MNKCNSREISLSHPSKIVRHNYRNVEIGYRPAYLLYESRGDLGPNNPGLPLSGTRRVGSTDGGVGAMLGSAGVKKIR
jgi:hypothetical protein